MTKSHQVAKGTIETETNHRNKGHKTGCVCIFFEKDACCVGWTKRRHVPVISCAIGFSQGWARRADSESCVKRLWLFLIGVILVRAF
jgi:hypothetical protein